MTTLDKDAMENLRKTSFNVGSSAPPNYNSTMKTAYNEKAVMRRNTIVDRSRKLVNE